MPSAARKVETSGLSDCSPTAASTLATSSPVVFSGGMKTATTESTSGSSIAASSASSKSSAVASAPSATGSLASRPTATAASAASRPERVGVADDRDPAAARQRLVGDELGDVEHLVEGVDLDHAGLPEHRVDRRLRRQHRTHRVTHRHALGGPAGLHRDHRLAPRDPARDPAELARVADRLEVEQHDLGVVVLLPVLQQVVAGDVGAVAGADERGQAEPAARHLLEDRDAERAGLAEEPGPPPRRHHRRERGVEAVVPVGVDDAQGVGPDEPQPVAARETDQLPLPAPALLAGLGEARRDHDQAVHALGGAVEHHVVHRLGRHRDDRDVDRVRDRRHRGVRRQPGDRRGRRVHDVHPALVVAEHEVAHQRLADGVVPARRADDRDAARRRRTAGSTRPRRGAREPA